MNIDLIPVADDKPSKNISELIEIFQEGLIFDDYTIYSKKIEEGRISNQKYLEIWISNQKEYRLMYISTYLGQKPYYKPWVELFNIKNPNTYYGSDIEDKLLNIISDHLGSGAKIFVEYSEDQETVHGLSNDFPPPVTRLGYKLFKNGFTWFKDWYFPEGFKEGGQKLQGEKPLNNEYRDKHLKDIENSIKQFLDTYKEIDEDSKFITQSIFRGEKILNDIKREIES